MKRKDVTLLLISVAALVLELLPWGAVLNFGNPEGEPLRRTYSYFDLTPYGYANFGPFLTALLTCLLSLFALFYIFTKKKWLHTAIRCTSATAVLTSLMPLAFGIDSFTLIGVGITALLALAFSVTLFDKNP